MLEGKVPALPKILQAVRREPDPPIGGDNHATTLAWWKWVVIVIGLFIIAVAAGRWVYHRVSVSKAPPPPTSPEEAAKELEAYYGYPVKLPARR